MNVPTVDKKITETATGTVAANGYNADARIGDVVKYELSSVIPTYTGYDITKPSRVLKLIDTASKGLTVTADSVKSVTLKKKVRMTWFSLRAPITPLPLLATTAPTLSIPAAL